jgi:hypothetical protein
MRCPYFTGCPHFAGLLFTGFTVTTLLARRGRLPNPSAIRTTVDLMRNLQLGLFLDCFKDCVGAVLFPLVIKEDSFQRLTGKRSERTDSCGTVILGDAWGEKKTLLAKTTQLCRVEHKLRPPF